MTTDAARRAQRTALVALAVGTVLVPLLFYFAAAAGGAEPQSSGIRKSTNSSLKWRAAGSRNEATVELKAAENVELKAPEETPPQLFAADVDAKPLRLEGPAKVAFKRDDAVIQTQAADPISDPFGDTKPAPAPRLLAEPKSTLTQPTVKAEPSLPLKPSSPAPTTAAPAPTTTLPPLPSSLDQLAAGGGAFQQEPCPTIADLKKITAITNNISASQGELPRECYFDESVSSPQNRLWPMTNYTWKASGLCHKPLYFEEVALERYGHSTGPFSQPVVSGAHFFGSLLVLPYKMGMDPPGECKYALGYYRPGSCSPYIVPGIPLSARGAAAQATAVTAGILLFP